MKALAFFCGLLVAGFSLAAPARDVVANSFSELATALGDAVARADDDAIQEYAGRIRALGLPVGSEIDLAQAQSLVRMHRIEAARPLVERYLASIGRQKEEAQLLLAEIGQREKLIRTSWRRPIDPSLLLPMRDGTFISAVNTMEDLAYVNIAVSLMDSQGKPLWRSVFGEMEENVAKDLLDLGDGRFVIAAAAYQGRHTFYGYKDPEPRWIVFDSLGRVIDTDVFIGNKQLRSVRGLASDGRGGFYIAYSMGEEGVFIARHDRDGRQLWSKPTGLQHFDGLATDAEKNAYLLLKTYQDGWVALIRKISPSGDILQSIDLTVRDTRSSIQTATPIWLSPSNSPGGIAKAFENKSDPRIHGFGISTDGSRAFMLLTQERTNWIDAPETPGLQRKLRTKADYLLSIEMANPTRGWHKKVGGWKGIDPSETQTVQKIGNTTKTVSQNHQVPLPFGQADLTFVMDRGEPVIGGYSQVEGNGPDKLRLRKFRGADGMVLWERSQPMADGDGLKSFENLNALFLDGHGGFFLRFRNNQGKSEILHLPATEFAAYMDGADTPLQQVAFMPFSEAIGSRAILQQEREALERRRNLADARADEEQTRAIYQQCKEEAASRNVIGAVQLINTDWNFLVVTLNQPYETMPVMKLVGADGSLMDLRPGKQVSPTNLSAMLDASNITAVRMGQSVVGYGEAVEEECSDAGENWAAAESYVRHLESQGVR